MRVGQRLYVNGEYVASNPQLLPYMLGPPVAYTPADFCSMAAFTQLRKHGLTFVQRSADGRVSLSFRSSFAPYRYTDLFRWIGRSMYCRPCDSNLLLIDQLYGLPMIRHATKAMAIGFLRFMLALISSPVTFARYAVLPLAEIVRMRAQSYHIRNGYVFNYGSSRSIREDLISYRRPHDFVAGDELTFILLTRHTQIRALRTFLRAHEVDMNQFASQEQAIVDKTNSYNVGEVYVQDVAVGTESRAGGSKKNSDPSDVAI